MALILAYHLQTSVTLLADVLVLVQPGTQHVVAEVERHQAGEKPVEVLQPGRVHVVRQPRRGAPDNADERRAKVEPERDDHGYHACGRVLERRGKLLVVQRHLPWEVQSLAEPRQSKRQDQPHGRQRRHPRWVALLAARVHGGQALALDDGGRGHADDGDHVARADALQWRRVVPYEAPPQREEDTVKEAEGDDDGDEGADDHGARRYDEAAHGAVHDERLQDREVDLYADGHA